MGLIKKLIGIDKTVGEIGRAAQGVSEVFVANATDRQEQAYLTKKSAMDQLSAEYRINSLGWFDRMTDGLNRLPRPTMAFGTIGLFAFAMINPEAFSIRMRGLELVPQPLWWLLSAIVSFYFGARELHYFRGKHGSQRIEPSKVMTKVAQSSDNAALDDWLRGQSDR